MAQDFPRVDPIIRKLKDFVTELNKKERLADKDEKEDIVDTIEEIGKFIEAISNYLDSVCNREYRMKLRQKTGELKETQELILDEEKKRTAYHSAIISSVAMIDRMAVKAFNTSPIFDLIDVDKDFSGLMPSMDEKVNMTPEERKLRRYVGNFGLYMAASCFVGYENVQEKDVELFMQEDDIKNTKEAFDKVKNAYSKHRGVIKDIFH